MWWIYVIIAVVVLLVIYFIVAYNSLVSNKNQVEEAFSTMDVHLKKRWDLVPNLVAIVKGYAKHEKESLENIVKLRKDIPDYSKLSTEEKIEVNNKLNKQMTKLFALAEAYPELKANENFLKLSDQLKEIEDEIANSRKYYNGSVRALNNKVQMFPSNLVAKMFHFKKAELFTLDNEQERENIKVEF